MKMQENLCKQSQNNEVKNINLNTESMEIDTSSKVFLVNVLTQTDVSLAELTDMFEV